MGAQNEKAFALWLLLVAAAQAHAATYIDIFNKGAFLVIEPHSVQLADVVHDATSCASSDSFACLKSNHFNIGMPKDARLKNWIFAGARYRIREELEAIFFWHTLSISID
ncbi:hypothetical protein ACFJIX_13105 [Roseateles sp. UC29_93]|uniref:hypothetical protein n=1 Tax=Roseateles sp. UC29_93 TaxID=3350177 RepID=UPI00366C5FB4